MDHSEYRLFRGTGADTVFTRTPKPQRRSGNTETGTKEKDRVLLAGGFKTVSYYDSLPVSAPMQLNGDLAGFDDSRMKQFAEAELGRIKQTSFNSYTVEPENLVCAVSNNSSELTTFMDTYGGLLDIVPLLLNQNNPSYDSITELSIANSGKKYRIDYSVRSPIDFERCNYCGSCGVSCPEQCISKKLFIDYSKCTLCRDCEKSCGSDAIDINTVEKRKLIVPAVIVLGSTSIELPEPNDNIYRSEQISNYFSSLFPFQVDELVSYDHSICQHGATEEQSGCSKCLDVCPSGAISFSTTIEIDHVTCVDCGRCAGVCPTGALQYLAFPDKSFTEFFREFQMVPGTTVVIGTNEDLHQFWWKSIGQSFENHIFLEYPKTGALSFFHLFFLLAHGAGSIIIFNNTRIPTSLQKVINDTNHIVSLLFGSAERVFTCSLVNGATLPEPSTQPPLTERPYTNLNYINRRRKIADIFQYLKGYCDTEISLAADEIEDLGTISCDSGACTQCLACLNSCKIEALEADSAALELTWQGALCVGCGLCISTCPENALILRSSSIILNDSYFSPTTIAKAEPMKCRECGKVFGTKKSFEHVMKVLASKNMDKDGFFEYCEDCRVLKLLESE